MDDQRREQERLQRLKQRQIEARDPTKKQRQMQRQIATRNKQMRSKENVLKDSIETLPWKLKGFFVGVFFGLIVVIALPVFWDHEWAGIVSILVLFGLMVIGFMLGASFDWRDKMRDYMRK